MLYEVGDSARESHDCQNQTAERLAIRCKSRCFAMRVHKVVKAIDGRAAKEQYLDVRWPVIMQVTAFPFSAETALTIPHAIAG